MEAKIVYHKDNNYCIRTATQRDAQELSEIRLQIDGETENLDRVKGEDYIDETGFKQLIQADIESENRLFLVAIVGDKLAGFSRLAGNHLQRFSHKAEFGVGILKEHWGQGIGNTLLLQSISWAERSGIKKITLSVLETNEKAIALYKKAGFQVEGILQNDKRLSDGRYYHTVLMGRWVD